MKRWVASAIAITMPFNGFLRADSYPEAEIETVAPLQEAPVEPQSAATTEEDTSKAEKKPAFTVLMTPPAEEPALDAPDKEEEEHVVEVGEASNEAEKAASKQRWQRIAIAAGAVIIATIALILVGTNQGHHH